MTQDGFKVAGGWVIAIGLAIVCVPAVAMVLGVRRISRAVGWAAVAAAPLVLPMLLAAALTR